VEYNFVSKETTFCDDISEIFRLATVICSQSWSIHIGYWQPQI